MLVSISKKYFLISLPFPTKMIIHLSLLAKPIVSLRVPLCIPKLKGVKVTTGSLLSPGVQTSMEEYCLIARAWIKALIKFINTTKNIKPSKFVDHLPQPPKSFNLVDDPSIHPTLDLEANSMVRLQVMRNITLLRLNVERKVTKPKYEEQLKNFLSQQFDFADTQLLNFIPLSRTYSRTRVSNSDHHRIKRKQPSTSLFLSTPSCVNLDRIATISSISGLISPT